jgi:predicted nucleic acid-binding protein
MKVFVDTNILLDVALQRAPHLADSDRVMKWCEAHPGYAFIAWHTVSNLYYLLEKQLDDAAAREFITTLVDVFEVVETGTAFVKHALHLPFTDFEDALQTVAAVAVGADVIVTRNKPDYAGSPIPVQTPGEFLASVAP